MKWILVLLFVASALYVHFRGAVRHRWSRQLLDHSTFMAPINVLMYALSRVPTTPFVEDPGLHFPELEPLRANWQKVRDEGRRLRELQQIKAAEGYNDVGFNSFFRRGWKRFYLKWYDDAHPSAAELCPETTALLRGIPSIKAAMFTELPPGSELRPHRERRSPACVRRQRSSRRWIAVVAVAGAVTIVAAIIAGVDRSPRSIPAPSPDQEGQAAPRRVQDSTRAEDWPCVAQGVITVWYALGRLVANIWLSALNGIRLKPANVEVR